MHSKSEPAISFSPLIDLWYRSRTSYWFLPSIMMLIAVGGAFGALRLDVLLGATDGVGVPWFGGMQAEAARTVLTTTASTLVTVAGVTFSMTLVVLQLASSQFGPRLLRNFMEDRGSQVTLGVFTSAFVYCVLVLAAVRDGPNGFVPGLAIGIGLLLGIAGMGVLIYFIHHIATAIRVEEVAAKVSGELDAAMDRLFPEQVGADPKDHDGADPQLPPDLRSCSRELCSPKPGYIRGIDADRLVSLASERHLIVQLERRPGDFVWEGTPLVRIFPSEKVDQQLAHAITGAFAIGANRTPLQDPGYPSQQLVEIALRALSPGINAPFTAIECINRLTQGLRRAAARRRPSPYRLDQNGGVLIISPADELMPLVIAALDPIARAGASNADIVVLLLQVVAAIAAEARYPADREALRRFADDIRQDADRSIERRRDRDRVEAAYRTLFIAAPMPGHASGRDRKPAHAF